jgi:membrane protease YdiL (CAAX protease family)
LILNILVNPLGFFRFAGFFNAHSEAWGWTLALIVFGAFTAFACRLPSVRANLFRFSWLKILALIMAVAAGFCEEAVFRKIVMDALAHRAITSSCR